MTDRPLPTPSPDALAAPLDGETVLLDLGSRRYFHLNPTAALIWDEMVAGHDRDAIAARLTATYDVDAVSAARAIDALVAQLDAHALVRAASTEG